MAGQVWGTANLGGYLALPELSQELRRAALPAYKFRQFAKPVKSFGANMGDTIKFDRVSNVAVDGAALTEGTSIPQTNFTLSQGSVLVNEFGNSIPYSGKVEKLSELNVNDAITQALKNDMAKVLDLQAATAMKSTKVKYAATGTAVAPTGTIVTTGTQSTAFTRHIQDFDVKEIVEYLRGTMWVPPYTADGYYMCVCSPGFARALRDSTGWENAMLYGNPDNLFSGEIGRYAGVRFIETAGNLKSIVDTSYKGEAVFFGEDPIVEAVAQPEEIRVGEVTDFGRNKKLAWYYIGGFNISFDTATPGECRIVHCVGLA